MLEVTSASQANLPSVAMSNPQEMHAVYIVKCLAMSQVQLTPKGGAAKYDSQDQAFSFSHKQVRFQDGISSPNLDIPSMAGQGPQSSTPYHTSNAALNRTFNISQISPLALVGVHQDAGCYSSGGFCGYSCSSFQGVLAHVGA